MGDRWQGRCSVVSRWAEDKGEEVSHDLLFRNDFDCSFYLLQCSAKEREGEER